MSMNVGLEQIIPVLVFVAVLLGVNGGMLILASRGAYRRRVSRRLSGIASEGPATKDLQGVRRERSLSSDGDYTIPIISLNRLILQSGATVGLFGVIASMVCLFAAAWLIAFAVQKNHLLALAAAGFLGVGGPLLLLRSMRARRQRRFEEQLPDAIDILVRSLRAGHAIPVAINTVARQMPDPVGGEFAITASELTYGLDLETALVNLRSRVGQIDLGLVVLAVSIQSKMGGNLAEILTNLSRVIRGRFRLRRKAKALSAEGRFSAVALSLIPLLLFCLLWVIAPAYYGHVWNEPFVKPVLLGAAAWLMLGNVIMYRMVRFPV
jgi:tight adherence protein B